MHAAVRGRGYGQVEVNFAFTDRGHEGAVMIYGTSERLVVILMPLRSDLDSGKLNRTAAHWAKLMRARFVTKEEVPEAEEAEDEAPAIPEPAGVDACGATAARTWAIPRPPRRKGRRAGEPPRFRRRTP